MLMCTFSVQAQTEYVPLPVIGVFQSVLFLLQEGGYGLVGVVDQGCRSRDGGLHHSIDEGDDGREDHNRIADDKGSEEGVDIDGFGHGDGFPYSDGNIPESGKSSDGLADADQLGAFPDHRIINLLQDGLEAADIIG